MKHPWMPLYVGDYLADTSHLMAAESGAYLHLLMHYWLNGGLPQDDSALSRIARMTPAQWARARPILAQFFQDGWKHKRVEFELTEAARLSAAGRAGGLASGAARRARRAAEANDRSTTVQRSANDRRTIREALQKEVSKEELSKKDPIQEEEILGGESVVGEGNVVPWGRRSQ